jgi:hypothetical protein
MQPYYRHIWENRGHKENNDGIKNYNDTRGLKGNEGKTT